MATLSFNSRQSASVSFYCGSLSPNITYVIQVKGGSTWYDKAGPYTPSSSGASWTGAISLDTTSSYSARLVANGIQVATATIPAYTPPVTTYTFRYTVYVYKYPTTAPYTSFTDSVKSTSTTAYLDFENTKARAYSALGDSSYKYRAFSAASYCYLSSSGTSIVLNNHNQTALINFSFEPPTYNYYIYWFDLYTSSSTPYHTSSKTGATTSTWSFTAPSISKTGYIFNGWCASASGNNGTGSIVVGDQESITLPYNNSRSITLYAKWTVKTYNIYFNAGGGTGSMTSMLDCMYPTYYTLNKNTYTKTQTVTYDYNYAGAPDSSTISVSRPFSYWSCSNGNTYSDQATVQGLTSTNGGSVTMTAQWGNYSTTLPTPTRSGYTFDGWYDAATGGNLVGAGGSTLTGTTNRTLYAHWTASVKKPTLSYSSHTSTSITVVLGRNGATSGSWKIEISTNSSFTNIISTKTISSSDSTTIVFTGLSPNTIYYFRATHIIGSATVVSDILTASTRIADFAWTSNDTITVVAGQVVSDAITAAKWIELGEKINWCLGKKGYSTVSFSTVKIGDTLTATIFNTVRNAIAKMDSSVTGEVSSGSIIKAIYFANNSTSLKSVINSIISNL